MRRAAIAALFAMSALGCASPPWSRGTLYDDLGGEAGLARIVSTFLEELAADARIVAFFDDTDIDRFERTLTEHLCVVADGPCRYGGDPLRTVHAGRGIRDADMNALVEDLQRAMRRSGVAWPVQNRLLARLARQRRDVVGVPSPESSRAEPIEAEAASRSSPER